MSNFDDENVWQDTTFSKRKGNAIYFVAPFRHLWPPPCGKEPRRRAFTLALP